MAALDTPESSDKVAVTITEEKEAEIQPQSKEKSKLIRKLYIPKKLPKATTVSVIFSVLAFILSLPILFSAIWLLYIGDYDCEDILGLSRLRLLVEVGLVVVFIVSNAIVFLRLKFPPGCVVAIIMLAFLAMVGLGMSGSYGSEAGHRLPASPSWLRMKIYGLDTWSDIKHCIYDTRVCDDLITWSLSIKPYEFTSTELSPTERGCCKPPRGCEMEYVNATFWKRPPSERLVHIASADCDSWVNNSTAMCFDCQSCKDAFLWTIESKWQKLGVFIVTMSILLLLCHLFLLISTMGEIHASTPLH